MQICIIPHVPPPLLSLTYACFFLVAHRSCRRAPLKMYNMCLSLQYPGNISQLAPGWNVVERMAMTRINPRENGPPPHPPPPIPDGWSF